MCKWVSSLSSRSGPSSVNTREIVFPSVRQVHMEAMVRGKMRVRKTGSWKRGVEAERKME